MKDTTVRVVTCGVSGALVRIDYDDAVYETVNGWLMITHTDTDPKNPTRKLKSRVPLANVVQILEIAPESDKIN